MIMAVMTMTMKTLIIWGRWGREEWGVMGTSGGSRERPAALVTVSPTQLSHTQLSHTQLSHT